MGEEAAPEILPDLITEQQLADRLQLSRDTLYRWRQQRIAPPHTKLGKTVWYSASRVEQWIADRQQSPLL